MKNKKKDYPTVKEKTSLLKPEGILLVNKAEGFSSFHLISLLRRICGEKKIGHGGTLDPLARGVVVILIGKKFTTRSSSFLAHEKEYLARIKLGQITPTYDKESSPKTISTKKPSLKEIHSILSFYQGEIEQIPPMFSAKKVKGKKLYHLARKGIEIKRQPCLVKISTSFVGYRYPYLNLHITCSKGTYIRSLANDIGKNLFTGGYLFSLTRIRSGPFHLKDCVDQNKLYLSSFHLSSWIKDYAYLF